MEDRTAWVESFPAPWPRACEPCDAREDDPEPVACELDLDGIHVVGVGHTGRSGIRRVRRENADGLAKHVPMHAVHLSRDGSREREDAWHMADWARALARGVLPDLEAATSTAPLVVLVVGLDEPLGAGAAPVLAQALRRGEDATVVAVCVEPAPNEPTAALALRCLAEHADTVILVPSSSPPSRSLDLARHVALVLGPAECGIIGVDIDEVRMIDRQGGRRAFAGWGRVTGKARGRLAVAAALGSLERVAWRAQATFARIAGGTDMRFKDIQDAFDELAREARDRDVVCSAAIDCALGVEVSVGAVLLGVEDLRGRM